MSGFTVVIPTLQRAATLPQLLRDLDECAEVDEVLVINNSPTPLPPTGPKTTQLRQSENLFVNPSWNLGVQRARSDYICLCNDDVLIPTALFARVAQVLRYPVGIVGPAPSCFSAPAGLVRPRFRPIVRRPYGFGTLMFFARSAYRPIPDSLKVWYGDDFLFHSQTRRNVAFSGVGIQTQMGTTSRQPEFQARFRIEGQAFEDEFAQLPLSRRTIERRLVRAASRLFKH